ncbi:MAG TPA: DUF5683 domain-containing protein [Chitinophagaceae bacterium]|nr:DUF5683 domain-containing protein [Chitinophagaceae bacterium]
MKVFSTSLAVTGWHSAIAGMLILIGSIQAVFAQDTLLNNQTDSVHSGVSPAGNISPEKPVSAHYPPRASFAHPDSLSNIHDPQKAALFSAVLPGLGQAYNHKYWKIPVAYAGLATATGFFVFNYKQYLIYRDAYRLSYSGQLSSDPAINNALSLYSQSDLKIIRDGYRQYVDYSALAFIGVYFINILDAIVDAHMYYFNVSDDISVHLLPSIQGNCAGLGLVIGLAGPSRYPFHSHPY